MPLLDRGEALDVGADMIDRPVLQTPPELALIGLVHRRCQDYAKVAVADVLDRCDRIRAHFESTGEDLGLGHLCQCLADLAAMRAHVEHKLDT